MSSTEPDCGHDGTHHQRQSLLAKFPDRGLGLLMTRPSHQWISRAAAIHLPVTSSPYFVCLPLYKNITSLLPSKIHASLSLCPSILRGTHSQARSGDPQGLGGRERLDQVSRLCPIWVTKLLGKFTSGLCRPRTEAATQSIELQE